MDRARAFVTAATLAAALGFALPVGVRAQIAWDAPLLVHPHAPSGWSVFLADPFPGDQVAVLTSWRTAARPVGFGARIGLGEDAGGDVTAFGGVDLSGSLVEYSDDLPVSVIWVAGAGVGLGGDVLVSVPAGLVAGWDLAAGDASFRPWVGPRVVLDARIGGGDELDLDAALDAGLDLALTGGWVVRFGLSTLDRDALAVGAAFPVGGGRR